MIYKNNRNLKLNKDSSIIFLTCNFMPVRGGISNYIYEIIRHLPNENIRIIGLPTKNSKQFHSNQNFKISRLNVPVNSASSIFFKFIWPVYFWTLKKYKNSSVVLCDCAHHTLLIPAILFSKFYAVPFGVFTHGTDLLKHQGKVYSKIFNKLLDAAEIVFSNSEQTKKILLSIGLKSHKIKVVYPNVNIQKFKDKASVETIIDRHNLHNKKIILTVSRLVERKGIDTFIKSMIIIIKSLPEAHYLIVGTGSYGEKLKELVCRYKLNKHITFAGFIPDEEINAYYSVCDLFVLVSRCLSIGDIEGFGIVFLEANYFGKPVLAGNSGGISEAVLHNKTGIIVDPDNIQEVAKAAVQLLENRTFSQKLGTAGRERVLNEFTGAASTNKLIAALREQEILI
ncbi:MAG: glycosyltransferase family 4 protein [Proteobacteria bacterium]|nr:glycosyltransferase family 4 protein [Pseudomonadota bacterium]